MKNGYAVFASSNAENEGFLILDKDGNITYNSNDHDDKTFLHYLGRSETDDIFLVYKQESSFAEDSNKIIAIDHTGKVIKEIDTHGKKIKAEKFVDLGKGILFSSGLNSIINTANWAYISDFNADMNGVKVAEGYLIAAYELVKLDKLTSQSSYESNRARNEAEFSIWNMSEGKSYYNGKYYDINGKVVLTPDIPEKVKLIGATEFKGGSAFLHMEGADKHSYVAAINEKGKFVFDPIMIEETDKILIGNNADGYVPVYHNELGSEKLICIIKSDGTVFHVGDDLSELGDERVLEHDDHSRNLYSNGFFWSYDLPETVSVGGSEVQNRPSMDFFFVSADGTRMIDKVYEYSGTVPEDPKDKAKPSDEKKDDKKDDKKDSDKKDTVIAADIKSLEKAEQAISAAFGKKADEAVKALGKGLGEDLSTVIESGDNFQSNTTASGSFKAVGLDFSAAETDFNEDSGKCKTVAFLASPSSSKPEDSVSPATAKDYYTMLASLLTEKYGKPSEVSTEDEAPKDGEYEYKKWKGTDVGDVFLCWGADLWSIEGYNNCIISFEASSSKSGKDTAENSLLRVEDGEFYIDDSLLGKSYDEANKLFGGDFSEPQEWEWDQWYDSFFDYTYNGKKFTFFLRNKVILGIRYEVEGNDLDKSRFKGYKAKYGDPKPRTYDDGGVIPAGENGYGWRYDTGRGYLDVLYNPYDDVDHIAMHYGM